MPFIRTSVHKDTSPQRRQAIVDGIHEALVEGIGMPADELFNLVGGARSAELLLQPLL